MSRQDSSLNGSGSGVIEAPADDPLVGATLGSYELVAWIGGGEHSAVYRAQHRLLGWERALKLLPAQRPDADEYVERLLYEVRVAARLRHPSIVQIHDVGLDERFAFIVLDLLDGQSLAELRSSGARLRSARSVGLLAQLATALDCAHDANITHGDLKPANIVVGPNDRLTLVDFGTARALGGTQVTDADRLIGTPAYLSPEMIRGVGDGVSADQYALGVLAYELLLWRLPFAGEDVEALLDAQVHQPPSPPREIRPELSEAVEQVLLRQLAKKPDDRYPTATEFVAALRMALEDRPARLDAARRAGAAPRGPDPWTSLQVELQEKHRSQQGAELPASRKSRRAFLKKTTLIVGTAAAGWMGWSLLRGRSPSSTTSGHEPAAPNAPATATVAPAGPAATPSPVAQPALSPIVPADTPHPGEAEVEPTSGSAGSHLGAGALPAGGHATSGF